MLQFSHVKMFHIKAVLVATVISICTISTAEVPYSRYILAPSKRVLSPQKVYGVSGTVDHAEALLDNHSGEATFGSNSSVTYDFGQNTAGLISFAISSVSDNNQWIGLSFSESNIWISPNGSDATQNVAIDETLWFQVESGNYSVEREHNRGGFRYLNVYHNTTGSVTLQNVTLYFTPMPHYADNSIGNYSGYYHCDDEKLNRVWYSAAYTNQLCTIPSDLGNALVDYTATDPTVPTFWWANSTLTTGRSALVDGGKRDRLIWPGDLSISLPSVLLSTYDKYTVKTTVAQLFEQQNLTTGSMPYVASPVGTPSYGFIYSFTYHLHGLGALSNYYIHTGDLPFLSKYYYQYKLGLALSLRSIDHTGLAMVAEDATPDWGRAGQGGHNLGVRMKIFSFVIIFAFHSSFFQILSPLYIC